MKSTLIMAVAALSILFQSCKKETDPEMALTGTHDVSIRHYGYSPSGFSGIQNFDDKYPGSMEITAIGDGIHINIHSDHEIINRALEIKITGNDTVRYTSAGHQTGEIDPHLLYIISTGNFYYYQSKYLGHRQSDTWEANGKL